MRNLKKFLALVLAMMMTLSLMVTVNASSFKDVEDTNTYVEAIDMLAALGVLKGQGADADGEFQPKGTITRAEMAAVLYRVVTGDVKDKNVNLYGGYKSFTDLNDGAWYIPYVNYCENNGLINGVGGGKFEPQEKLTGYQALVMILRAMGYNNPNEFSSSDWKLKASGYGRKLGITNRIEEGSLGAPATRESVAEIVFQAIQKPTVSYNMLLGYTNDVLVAANKDKDGNWIYDHDVYNTLLYQVFGIVGKRTIMGSDGKYGRPIVEWVKDAKDDTVANGGKYIVNPQANQDWTTATQKAAVKDNLWVTEGAVYVPINTPGATYGELNPVDKAGYIPNPDKIDVTVYSIKLAPVYTFNKAMTECDLSKAINNDKKISWSDITEYVNGGKVVNRNDKNDNGKPDYALAADGGDAADKGDNGSEAFFDALHTTNTSAGAKTSDYTIGAAGRQTEIYKLPDGTWIFVYIDTVLGEVEKVVPHTLDTNDHVMTPAELHIGVNDAITGTTAIVMYQDDNFSQKVGDLVTLTTWGLKDDTTNAKVDNYEKIGKVDDGDLGTATAIEVNYAILNAVPDDEQDTTTDDKDGDSLNLWEAYEVIAQNEDLDVVGKGWAVDFASKSVGENATVPTTTITVEATVGLATDKDGVIADGKTIPTTWTYHVDHGIHLDAAGAPEGAVADENHTKTGTDVNDETVLNHLCVDIKNSIIGQTFTVALDKSGNIMGMWQGTSDKMIGVITDVDYTRIGLGKYAVELEIFTVDGKTETVRMLKLGNEYFPTQDEADVAIKDYAARDLGFPANSMNPKGALVELASYVKDGATYWAVNDKCDTTTEVSATPTKCYGDVEASDASGDGKVEPGKADTLVGAVHDENTMTDETVFIVAEYEFHYNTKPGSNDGSNIDIHYNVYKGFRNLPVINADQKVYNNIYNLAFQILDGKVTGGTDKTDGEAKYVLISAIDPEKKYTMSKHPAITVDDSFLVIAPIATYDRYSTYSVAKNGELKTITVSNVNTSVNEALQNAIRTKGLMISTSENSQGWITAVETLADIITAGKGDSTYPNYGMALANVGGVSYEDTKIPAGKSLTYSKGVLTFTDKAGTGTDHLTVAEGCIVKIVNVDNGQLYPATLDNIKQYQATHDVVFELDSNGWVCCLYIID